MLKKTKIICTQGPATDVPGVIEKLVANGMNCARFNFSHGTHEEHAARIKRVRDVVKASKTTMSLILDTKGPEMRLGNFKDGSGNLMNQVTKLMHQSVTNCSTLKSSLVTNSYSVTDL